MKIAIKIKDSKEPIIYSGERIDVLDFNMNGIDYKQIRYFRKGFSKSELIMSSLILSIKEIEK